MDIKEALILWFISFFDKNSASLADKFNKDSGVAMLQNEQLDEELHNLFSKKFKKKEFIFHLNKIFGVMI